MQLVEPMCDRLNIERDQHVFITYAINHDSKNCSSKTILEMKQNGVCSLSENLARGICTYIHAANKIFPTVCVDNPGGMFVPVSAVYAVQSAAVLQCINLE